MLCLHKLFVLALSAVTVVAASPTASSVRALARTSVVTSDHVGSPSLLTSSAASTLWAGIRRGGSRAVQSIETDGPFQLFCRTIMEARRHLAAAAAARSTSIFLMFPVDTIKVRVQLWQTLLCRTSFFWNRS
jgi:hypothetical protein